MNKSIVSLLLAGALLSPAFFAEKIRAEESGAGTPELISEERTERAEINRYIGTVRSVDRHIVSVEVETEEGGYNASFGVTERTPIYDITAKEAEMPKEGDRVIVFSEASLYTRDIKPAEALVITDENAKESVYCGTFSMTEEDGFISKDRELVLNMDKELCEEYDGKRLLVFSELQTLSLPPQTNPTAVIVLGDDEESDEEKIEISFNIGDSVLLINGNGVEVEKPYVVGIGVTLVPLRVISEAFGAEVDWEEDVNGILISFGEKNVGLKIDDKAVTINDEEDILEEAPQLTENGFAMVPLRFISETFGAEVGYDEETREVTVRLDK